MKPDKIIDNNIVLAMIVKNNEWKNGLNFISSNEDFQQVGFWGYDKGQKLLPHIHRLVKREVLKTQEVIFVKKGSLKVDIFSQEGKIITSRELNTGDTAVFLNGGHGYEILEDNTQVLEIKNGPYLGPEEDRKRI